MPRDRSSSSTAASMRTRGRGAATASSAPTISRRAAVVQQQHVVAHLEELACLPRRRSTSFFGERARLLRPPRAQLILRLVCACCSSSPLRCLAPAESFLALAATARYLSFAACFSALAALSSVGSLLPIKSTGASKHQLASAGPTRPSPPEIAEQWTLNTSLSEGSSTINIYRESESGLQRSPG